MATVTMQPLAVRKSIVVEAPREHVFEVFTTHLDQWWPRSHHIGTCESFTAVLERKPGGRWYERGSDGSECEWGSVLEWQPPTRILLAWNLDPEWHYDAREQTLVEITFTAEGPERTRVDLEHRGLERFGERGIKFAEVIGSDGGWAGLLRAMRDHAQQHAARG